MNEKTIDRPVEQISLDDNFLPAVVELRLRSAFRRPTDELREFLEDAFVRRALRIGVVLLRPVVASAHVFRSPV